MSSPALEPEGAQEQDGDGGILTPSTSSDQSTPSGGIDESGTPAGGLFPITQRKPPSDESVRAAIAYSILAGLGLLYGGLFWAFLVNGLPLESFTAAAAALSAPQSLAAAAVGFYYAKK